MQKAPLFGNMVGALTKPLFKELQDESYRFRLEGLGLRAWGLEQTSLQNAALPGWSAQSENTEGPKPLHPYTPKPLNPKLPGRSRRRKGSGPGDSQGRGNSARRHLGRLGHELF